MNETMKPNISLACKKPPSVQPVKTKKKQKKNKKKTKKTKKEIKQKIFSFIKLKQTFPNN